MKLPFYKQFTMRIAFLLTTSLESPYGLGRCWPFAQELARLGHEVHIIALHHDLTSATSRHFQQEGVQIDYVGQMHVRKVGDGTFYYRPLRLLWVMLTGLWGLLIQALWVRADLYHIGKPHPQNSIAGLLAARLLQRCVMLDYDDLESAINRTSNQLQRQVLGWFEDHIPQWVDGVTVHSQFLAERLHGLGIDKAKLLRLPSCVATARFAAVASNEQLLHYRIKWGLTNKRVILYVGTLALINHPVDLLLCAFRHLCQQQTDVMLLLVGGGADLASLQMLAADLGIAEACRFVGRVPSAMVPTFFQLADLTVDPVHDDEVARARWPLKIIESLAAGVPIVTGDVGDRCVMLGDGAAGLLVPAGDAEALAQAMAKILTNSALQMQLRQGCAIQMRRYDCAQLTANLVAFYQAGLSL